MTQSPKPQSIDPAKVKQRCNGMLPEEVYQRIYETALTAQPGHMVEVGCAHGAGTVCMAAGLRDSGREGTVYTFEKILGGTREAFGSIEKNTAIIKGNFAEFGLEDRIELIIGDVDDHADKVPADDPIGLLCLDADGAIDRDFALFFDRLASGAPIILDDVQDRTRVKKNGMQRLNQKLKVDQKHRLTYRFLKLFQDRGLLDQGALFGADTWFGTKGEARFADVDPAEVLAVYRSMTFTDASLSAVPLRASIANVMRAVLPKSAFERAKRMESGS